LKTANVANITGTDVAVFLEPPGKTPDTERRLYVEHWGPAEWNTLFEYTVPVELDAGEVLIEQNASDRALFFVTSGKLEVASIDAADSSVSRIATISPGFIVGEFSFFDGGPRSAKVWAVARSRLLKLTLQEYERYRSQHLAESSSLLFALAHLLAVRVRNAIARR